MATLLPVSQCSAARYRLQAICREVLLNEFNKFACSAKVPDPQSPRSPGRGPAGLGGGRAGHRALVPRRRQEGGGDAGPHAGQGRRVSGEGQQARWARQSLHTHALQPGEITPRAVVRD